MGRTILFLCTGNYYRSRFAEIYFNALTGSDGLGWRAVSRGLATERGLCNLGPISPQAVEGLATRGIPVPRPLHWPLQVLHRDLEDADLIVAVKEAEHLPLVEARFPSWSERVQYWHIDDLEQVPAAEALPQLEQRVRSLLDRLSRDGDEETL